MSRTALRSHLETVHRGARLQAGSLIMTVFGDGVLPRGGRIWLGSLIRLLEPLGLNERLVRTAVFRLAREDWLRAEASGRRSDYVLTNAGESRFLEASRHIYAANPPAWDGQWRFILTVGEVGQKDREALRRALFWQGFGSLGNDGFVHPGTGLDVALDALSAEGLGHLRGALLPLLAAGPGLAGCARDSELVARAWNLEKLGLAYGEFLEIYEPVAEALAAGLAPGEEGDEEAFLLRILLIHDFRRLLLRDPELPEELLLPDWPGEQARALCRRIYQTVLTASERHLDRHFQLAAGVACDPSGVLANRFRQD